MPQVIIWLELRVNNLYAFLCCTTP